MTERESMSEKHECGTDAAAYVLGALEPAEAEAFRAHLATCVVCRDEVNAFQEVANLLPLTAAPEPVPSGLKARVMAEVHAEARAAAPEAARPARRRWFPASLAIPNPAFAAAAVVLVLAVAIGAIVVGTGGSTTHVYHASVTWPGSATVHVTNGHGELVVNRMPAPPMTKVYEVWLQSGSGRPQATTALFSPTASGSGSVDVPGNLHGVSRILVTPEPAGGSTAPTHAPVLIARLS
jgi:anti-sigma-K factor RskA